MIKIGDIVTSDDFKGYWVVTAIKRQQYEVYGNTLTYHVADIKRVLNKHLQPAKSLYRTCNVLLLVKVTYDYLAMLDEQHKNGIAELRKLLASVPQE